MRRINRVARQSLVLAAATVSCISGAAKVGSAAALDPLAFTSLGTFNVTSGTININTDTNQITGAATFTGTSFVQGGGNPTISVFDFTGFTLGSGVTVNITGARPLALLSRGNMSVGSTLSVNGNAGSNAGALGLGIGGGGNGGTGGTSGSPGLGLGGGNGTGPSHDGGGAGFGGAGGVGDTNSIAGGAYGNLSNVLQAGSGGGGGASTAGSAGGGGAGGGAIELGAVNSIAITAPVTANGGMGGTNNFDGGGGSGGGLFVHAGAITTGAGGALNANGANGISFGGAGAGGRLTLSIGSFSTSAPVTIAANAVGGSAGGGGGTATAGSGGFVNLNVDTYNLDTNITASMGSAAGSGTSPSSLTAIRVLNISNGQMNVVSPYLWGGSGGVNITGGTFNLAQGGTFATGSTLNHSAGKLIVGNGNQLVFNGGAGTLAAGGLSDGAQLRILANSTVTAPSYFDIGSSATNGANGTLFIAGANAKFTAGTNVPFTYTDWGLNAGDVATVTIADQGAATFNTGLQMAGNGGSANVNINTLGKLTVNKLLVTGTGGVVGRGAGGGGGGPDGFVGTSLTVNGGILASNGTADFRSGTTVNLQGAGTIALGGDATFRSGANLNWSGGTVTIANGKTLTLDGGNANVTAGGRGLTNGATLKIINGGQFTTNNYFDLGSSLDAGNGPVGTLLVQGSGSKYLQTAGGLGSVWGANVGDSATVTFASGGAGTLSAGVGLGYNGGKGLLQVSSGGSLWAPDLAAGGGLGSNASLIIVNGGTLTTAGESALRRGAELDYTTGGLGIGGVLNTSSNAKVVVVPGENKTLRTGGLSMSGTSKIDLWNNDMHIKGGVPLNTVRGYIATAYNFGGWDGPMGITSSAAANGAGNTTLGILSGQEYLDNNGATTFNGVGVASSDVLVKYTYYGDVDFNGAIDASDYNLIDFGFVNHLTGWGFGDADYSGSVDVSDYNVIDFAFSSQNGVVLRAMSYLEGYDPSTSGMEDPALQMVMRHYSEFGEQYRTGFLAQVPEPTSTSLIGVATAALLRRRRRPA